MSASTSFIRHCLVLAVSVDQSNILFSTSISKIHIEGYIGHAFYCVKTINPVWLGNVMLQKVQLIPKLTKCSDQVHCLDINIVFPDIWIIIAKRLFYIYDGNFFIGKTVSLYSDDTKISEHIASHSLVNLTARIWKDMSGSSDMRGCTWKGYEVCSNEKRHSNRNVVDVAVTFGYIWCRNFNRVQGY